MDESELGELLREVRAARAETAAMRAELQAARLGGPSKGIATLRELYLAALDVTAKSRATIGATLAPAARYFGEKAADEATRADWTHWRDNVRAKETTVRKGNPMPYTLNLEVKRWRAVYRWGKRDGHCHTNPLTDVKMLRAKPHRHTRPEEGEIERLLAESSPMLRAFVLLGARTGMRAAEVRAIEWSEVDLRRGRIAIPWNRTKTRKERKVPLTGDVIVALKAIKPELGGRYVFENPETREPYGRTRLWDLFRDAVDRAGLKAAAEDGRVVFHDLRHTFTSWATGLVPLPVALAISGHKDLRSAARYIQVTEGQISDAQKRLDEDARKPAQKSQVHDGDDSVEKSAT